MASNSKSRKQFAEKQAWFDADGGVTTLSEVIALAEGTAAVK
jgi:hypothetical protein